MPSSCPGGTGSQSSSVHLTGSSPVPEEQVSQDAASGLVNLWSHPVGRPLMSPGAASLASPGSGCVAELRKERVQGSQHPHRALGSSQGRRRGALAGPRQEVEAGRRWKKIQEKMVQFSLLASIFGLKGFKAFIFIEISNPNIEIVVSIPNKVQRHHINGRTRCPASRNQ